MAALLEAVILGCFCLSRGATSVVKTVIQKGTQQKYAMKQIKKNVSTAYLSDWKNLVTEDIRTEIRKYGKTLIH